MQAKGEQVHPDFQGTAGSAMLCEPGHCPVETWYEQEKVLTQRSHGGARSSCHWLQCPEDVSGHFYHPSRWHPRHERIPRHVPEQEQLLSSSTVLQVSAKLFSYRLLDEGENVIHHSR